MNATQRLRELFNKSGIIRLASASQEFRFTPPVQVLYALEQALVEYFQETEQGRYKRYTNSYEELIAGLSRLGFQLLLPAEQHSKLLTAVIEPTHPNYSYDAMHDN